MIDVFLKAPSKRAFIADMAVLSNQAVSPDGILSMSIRWEGERISVDAGIPIIVTLPEFDRAGRVTRSPVMDSAYHANFYCSEMIFSKIGLKVGRDFVFPNGTEIIGAKNSVTGGVFYGTPPKTPHRIWSRT